MKKIIVFLILKILLFTGSIASGKTFVLNLKNSDNHVLCGALKLENGNFKCAANQAVYQYPAESVLEVAVNEKVIYPYSSNRKITIDNLNDESCKDIFAYIKGPLTLEHNEQVHFLVGKMYEQGICAEINLEKARKYYLNAGDSGKAADASLLRKHPELIKRAEIEEEYLIQLQKDADEKRRLLAIKEAECQKDCMVNNDVENKYRYNTRCYEDCMAQK